MSMPKSSWTPFSADQAPGTLHPNAFKTSNKTNVLCLHVYRQTDIRGETASGLNIKVFGGFNDSLNLSTGFAARTEQQLLVWGWASAWWGRVSERAGAWSCIIARFVKWNKHCKDSCQLLRITWGLPWFFETLLMFHNGEIKHHFQTNKNFSRPQNSQPQVSNKVQVLSVVLLYTVSDIRTYWATSPQQVSLLFVVGDS